MFPLSALPCHRMWQLGGSQVCTLECSTQFTSVQGCKFLSWTEEWFLNAAFPFPVVSLELFWHPQHLVVGYKCKLHLLRGWDKWRGLEWSRCPVWHCLQKSWVWLQLLGLKEDNKSAKQMFEEGLRSVQHYGWHICFSRSFFLMCRKLLAYVSIHTFCFLAAARRTK